MTLCTVVPPGGIPSNTRLYEEYEEVMLESVLRKTTLVTKILIAVPNPDLPDDANVEEWTERNVQIKRFTVNTPGMSFGHAVGLHACIDRVDQEYILFSDPDVFYYTAIDQFYLGLLNKHVLNYIGGSHHSAVANSYMFFPHFMSALVKKRDLPGPDFLRGKLFYRSILRVEELDRPEIGDQPADGKYLVQGPIRSEYTRFPNKDPLANFDCGCNLYLWAQEADWRWLAFQTLDCHTYTSRLNRGNFKLNERLSGERLFWHAARSDPQNFRELWQQAKEEE